MIRKKMIAYMKKITFTKVLGIAGGMGCVIFMVPMVVFIIFAVAMALGDSSKSIPVDDLELQPQMASRMVGMPDDVVLVYDSAYNYHNELNVTEVRAHLEGKGVEPFLKNLKAKVKEDPVHWRKGDSKWMCSPANLREYEAYDPYTFNLAWGVADIHATKECESLAKAGMLTMEFSSTMPDVLIHYEFGNEITHTPPRYCVPDSLEKRENLILPHYREVNYSFAHFVPFIDSTFDYVETVAFDSPRDVLRLCSTLPRDAYDAETDEWVVRHKTLNDTVKCESHYLYVRIKKDGRHAHIEYGDSYN